MLILLLLFSGVAIGQSKLVVSGLSLHASEYKPHKQCYRFISECRPLNGLNYGLGINEYYNSSIYWTAGAYKNSFYKISTYIGIGYDFSKYSGIKVAVVTGYPEKFIIPMIVPYISIPTIFGVEVMLVAPFLPGWTQVVGVQIRWLLRK